MKKSDSLAARWLWLGVAALACAGVFAIALVAARTPQLGALKDLFPVALVVHVDLSVLIWFLCIGGMGWSALIEKRKPVWPYWQSAAFYLIAAATAAIALSPFSKPWDVIKSNYVPVLDNQLFMLGIVLLAAGLSVMLVQLLVAYMRPTHRRAMSYVELGWLYAGFTAALAIIAFFISGYYMEDYNDREVTFDTLFWAGGHILQFSYCALMMAAWLLLLETLTGKKLKTFAIFIAYALLAAGAIAQFAGFAIYAPDTEDFRLYQSKVMIELLGIGPVVMAGIIIGPLIRHLQQNKKRSAYLSTLIMSLILFAAGGALGMMIHGQNVTIPAHYHGAIVGVTLALMGAAYAMLPQFGYKSVAATRLAFWQPIIYGVGQLMHIGALAYSGGYGVLRKTPDAAASLPVNLKISMGIMGLGGTLAILGGLLFVLVMARAYLQQRRAIKR